MNPIVITGMLAMAVFSVALMITLSNEQVRYSHTVEAASEAQSQRLREEMAAVLAGSQVLVENTGPVRITVKEIRVLDSDGYVVHAQKADSDIAVGQDGHAIELDPGTVQAIAQLRDAEGGR